MSPERVGQAGNFWTHHRILFDGENISFDATLVLVLINIPPIMIINRI